MAFDIQLYDILSIKCEFCSIFELSTLFFQQEEITNMSETRVNLLPVEEDRNMFLGRSLSEQNKKPTLKNLGQHEG